jgi:hypothetical protein
VCQIPVPWRDRRHVGGWGRRYWSCEIFLYPHPGPSYFWVWPHLWIIVKDVNREYYCDTYEAHRGKYWLCPWNGSLDTQLAGTRIQKRQAAINHHWEQHYPVMRSCMGLAKHLSKGEEWKMMQEWKPRLYWRLIVVTQVTTHMHQTLFMSLWEHKLILPIHIIILKKRNPTSSFFIWDTRGLEMLSDISMITQLQPHSMAGGAMVSCHDRGLISGHQTVSAIISTHPLTE